MKYCHSTDTNKATTEEIRFRIETAVFWLTESGPSTSGEAELLDNNEIDAEEEKSLLADSEEDLKSGQRWLTCKHRHEEQQESEGRKRPGQDDSAKALESKITKLKESIAKSEAHPKKKKCPKSLHYHVHANITTDEDFTTDVSSIRRDAE